MFMVNIKDTSRGFTSLLYGACQCMFLMQILCKWKVPDTPYTLYSKSNLLKESREILFFHLFKFSVTQMRMLFASSLFILLSTKKTTRQPKPTINAPQRSNKVLLGQFGKIGSILFEWRVTCYLRAATPTEKHIICANCCASLLVKLCLAPLFLC